jgi:hypothetical protein
MASHRNYGAIESADDNDSHHDAEGFNTQRLAGRIRKRLHTDIQTQGADFILILLFFVSGLVDGSVYNSWGSFVSMQTGTPEHSYSRIKDPNTKAPF